MEIICKTCGNTFEVKRKDKQYCAACMNKRRSLQTMLCRKKKHPEIELGVGSGKASCNLPGPTNKAWKTGIQGYRKLVDKDCCAYCGSKQNLLIHHKDENRHNNEVSNLIVLCKRCHQKYHTRRGANGQYVKLQTNTEITS